MNWSKLFNSFVPQRKSNPLLGVLSAVGSVGSSLFSQESQQQENQKNRDFTLEMWNRQNEYNSPKHQAELLREGGYNPYILSNQGTGSLAQTPSSPQSSPLPAMQNPATPLASVIQQGLQIESNVELQKTKTLESLTDSMLKVYKDLGQKGLEQWSESLAPVLSNLDFGSSPYMEMFQMKMNQIRSETYNTDMDSLLKDFQYESNKEWTNKERSVAYLNTKKQTESVIEQIKLMSSESELNNKRIWELASEYVKNMAEAYQFKKVGDYYEVSAGQMSIMNDILDLEYQEKSADFAFNTWVRKFKKEIPNRQYALDIFKGQLGSQGVQLGIQQNAFLQNFKEFTGAIGNLVKVNFGLSTNRTNFNNLNPQKGNNTLFYSGDGYYLNNGVLQKGNW